MLAYPTEKPTDDRQRTIWTLTCGYWNSTLPWDVLHSLSDFKVTLLKNPSHTHTHKKKNLNAAVAKLKQETGYFLNNLYGPQACSMLYQEAPMAFEQTGCKQATWCPPQAACNPGRCSRAKLQNCAHLSPFPQRASTWEGGGEGACHF